MKHLRKRMGIVICAVMAVLAMGTTPAFGATSYPVAIDAAHFPDDTFRSFVSQRFDTNRDGQLSEQEASIVKYIDVNYQTISTVQGIEYFPNLQTLLCSLCGLDALDVSQNSALVTLDVRSNNLESIDLSNNPALTYVNFGQNKLTAIDLSNNTALVGVSVGSNPITALNVSMLPDLRTLSCDATKITQLDVTHNPLLAGLSCGNLAITELDVSQNPELTSLQCYGAKIGSLDLSNATKLQVLGCEQCELTSLDVTKCPDLTNLSCSLNAITELDLGNTTKLTYLNCANNKIPELDLRGNPGIAQLYCSSNVLTSLDTSSLANLNTLSCSENQIGELNLSNNRLLGTLFCSKNLLTKLDVSGCPNIALLYCNINLLTSMDLSANERLSTLNCGDNRLTTLDLSNNMRLSYAAAYNNYLLDMKMPNIQFSVLYGQTRTVPLQESTVPGHAYESVETYSAEVFHEMQFDRGDVVYDLASGHFYTDNVGSVGFTTPVAGANTVSGTIQFIPEKVTVTFVDWDGSVLKAEQVAYGGSVTPPSDPNRLGYTFVGWEGRYTEVTEDSTVTAVYAAPGQFTVTFYDLDETTVLSIQAVNSGTSAIPPEPPVYECYTFEGWRGDYTNVTENRDVYAVYEIKTHTVFFRDWDDTLLKEEQVNCGSDATPPEDPSRLGYDFLGWDNSYTDVRADTIVHATYDVSHFTIVFTDWDGAVLDTQVIDYGTDASPPTPPSHQGYVFVQWDGAYTEVTADATVVATYAIETHLVTFVDWDGTVLWEEMVDYGQDATPPADPLREGYTFSGWSGSYTDVTADQTVTATYTKNGSGPVPVPSPNNPKPLPTTGDSIDLRAPFWAGMVSLGILVVAGGALLRGRMNRR